MGDLVLTEDRNAYVFTPDDPDELEPEPDPRVATIELVTARLSEAQMWLEKLSALCAWA